MSPHRPSALIVCPGRGTYNRSELGYLSRHHAGRCEFLHMADSLRRACGQTPVRTLDSAAAFSAAHASGENASALIFACSFADFLALDRNAFDIVAVTGNSMGWYTALACGEVLAPADAFNAVNTMGTLMDTSGVGGQLVYPLLDGNWHPVAGRRDEIAELIAAVTAEGGRLFVSIDLGGMLVLAGDDAGLEKAAARLPPLEGRYPMRLAHHAAFHTPLLAHVADRARSLLGAELFHDPALSLVDGRGRIWRPRASHLAALWDYTFGEQVTAPYDFAAALRVAMREFAPEVLIVLGPGDSLGGAVAQTLVGLEWQGLAGKAEFTARQASDPLVLAMGRGPQRALALRRAAPAGRA